MDPNPVLKALGFSDDDRAVIFHADDIGMCQASLAAYVDLVDEGLISAASTMVPCSWFPATADFCRMHPDKVDMGVHITLNSEWSKYRWSAVSTRDPESGLLDAEGYMHQSRAEAVKANPDAVRREIQAQVQRARDAGIDVTHIDTHMGSVFTPQFLNAYVETALEHQVPPMLVRQDTEALHQREDLHEMGVEDAMLSEMIRQFQALETRGVPMVDDVRDTPLNDPDLWPEHVTQTFNDLPKGTLTYFIVHPSKDTPELRAITEHWRRRVTDYEAFKSETLRQIIQDTGIRVVGWRTLRELMRQAL